MSGRKKRCRIDGCRSRHDTVIVPFFLHNGPTIHVRMCAEHRRARATGADIVLKPHRPPVAAP